MPYLQLPYYIICTITSAYLNTGGILKYPLTTANESLEILKDEEK